MEHQKILNLLNQPNHAKFVTRKWNIANDQSNANYDVGIEIIYNTEVLKSNLRDFDDAYLLVRGDIVTTAYNNQTPVAFKKCATFVKCIPKIDGTTLGNAEDWDLVMSMCNLIEYNSIDSEKTGSLWFYYKDEATNFNAYIANNNNNNFESFECKAKLLGNTVADGANRILRNATIAVPLKHLNIFRRSLEIPLINWKIELKLQWTKYSVLSAAGADNNDAYFNNIIFTVKDTILYVSAVTLPARSNQKLSKLLTKGFERSIY